LAGKLLDSLSSSDPSLREAWIREAESRMQALREGKISLVDGPEALARLRSRFEE